MSPQSKTLRSQRTLIIKLQEAMREYTRATDQRMNYEILAKRTGIPEGRIKSIGGRRGYNASLDDLAEICVALKASPGDLLVVGTRKKQKNVPRRVSARRKKATPKKRTKALPKAKGKPGQEKVSG